VTQVEAAGGPGAPGARARGNEPGGDAGASASLSLSSFTHGRLVSPEDAPEGSEWVARGIYRFPVGEEAHVSAAAVLATDSGVTLTHAHRRERGRLGEVPLGGGGQRFYRCGGQGEVWLTSPRAGAGLISLALEDDVFYAREQQVLAFAGDLVWEWGRVPLCPLRMLQFRGSGRVLVDWRGADVLALRLTDPRQVKVLSDRLLGWIGRVVAQGAGASGDEGGAGPVACQGEGVLLIARHGQIEGRVHERAQPGDDGARAPHPGGPALHR
jgi:uncharacterized protein (AIM24 family)